MARQPTSLNLAGEDANTLHKLLLEGKDFNFPDIDLGDIDLPELTGFDKLPDKITVDELTERKFAGSGVFDALMESVYRHIEKEFQDGRITANEYTKQYISAVEVSMSNAVQFLLQKDVSYWQGITAQIQAYQARVQLEVTIQQAKAQLAGLKYDALIKEAQFTNTKMQTLNIESAYQNSEFNLSNILPANENLIVEQTEVQRAQTAEERSDGKSVRGAVGKNKELTDAQILAFDRDAQYKVGKLHTDTWIAMRSSDEDLLPPDTFTNASIASVVGKIKLGVNIR